MSLHMRQVFDKHNGRCHTLDFSRMLIAVGIGISPLSIRKLKDVSGILHIEYPGYFYTTSKEVWVPLTNEYQQVYKNYLADKELLGE